MGRAKLLLPYGGRTVLEHAVTAALESGAGLTVVVLGHEAAAARKVLAETYPGRADLRVVSNPDYLTGQASSLRVGLRAVLDAFPELMAAPPPGSSAAAAGNVPLPALPRAVVFCLGDQPLVTAETVTALIDAYLSSPARPGPVVVAPVHAGRRGNPVLIDRRLFPELLALTGDVGARGVLDRHAGAGTLLVPAGPEVLVDLDTPEDYARLGPASDAGPGDGSDAGPDSAGSPQPRRPGSATS
jgi:molybdenum cofactor cytidylyltransferase